MTGLIWGLRSEGEKVTWHRELARTPVHLVAFGENNDGELYLLDYDRTHQIYRLVPNLAVTSVPDFPRRLSQTGLFKSTIHQQPAPGVIPYSVNAELWADGATAERFLAVPDDGKIGLDNQGNWRFPDGSALARTVSIEQEPGQQASRRRMETQILHFDADAWRPYSYIWNADQSDALLAEPAGSTLSMVQNAPSGRHEVNYRVHARTECVLCHNPWVEKKNVLYGAQSASPLGINMPQLNKPRDTGTDAPNQIATWHKMGLLDSARDLGKDGRIMSGLLVQKTNEAVVIKDAQGKTSSIPVTEIEQFVPQSRSMMPELLLRDLTAQQVADLLEYLSSLR